MSKISKRPTRANRERKHYDRQFLGKVKDFESYAEEAQEKAHLKAYIKGKKAYKWGTITTHDHMGRKEVKPRFLEVQQKITETIKTKKK